MNKEKVEKVIINLINDENFKNQYLNNFDSLAEEFELSTADIAFLKNTLKSSLLDDLAASTNNSAASVYGCFDAY